MPIPMKPRVAEPRKAVTIRMEQSVDTSLHQYADFLGCTLDYVVVEALKLVFKKDTEFHKWVSKNPESESNQQAAEQDSVQPISVNPTKQTR